MTSDGVKKVLLLTYDLNLNQTSSKRYYSFIKAISNTSHLQVAAIGIRFPFKSHPINPDQYGKIPIAILPYIKTIEPVHLNIIQRLLVFIDKNNGSYFLKKILLALHIVFYRTDQWCVDLRDLENLDFVPDVIISGGSGGIIKTSYELAKKYNATLVLDYRDPWNFGYNLLETNKLIYYFKKSFTTSKELEYLRYAAKVTTVSASLKSFFPKKIQDKIFVLNNGSSFEDYDFTADKSNETSTFLITYLGTIYNDQLLDEAFFRALSTFITRKNLNNEDIQLNFFGSSKNLILPKIIQKYNLTEYTQVTERKEIDDLVSWLQQTRLFLHLKYGDRSQIISSKQADYLLFRKPILLPNTDRGDIAESIISNKAGYVLNGGLDEIIKVLEIEYEKFLKEESAMLEERDLSALSRSKIAEKLLELIA